MSSDVTFIRRNGRVIPIRKKSEEGSKPRKKKASSDRKAGASAVAAGVGVGVGAAAGAALIVKKSGEQRIKARGEFRLANALKRSLKKDGPQLSFGFTDIKAKKLRREAAARRDISNMMFRTRIPLLLGGSAIAASLIGAGRERLNRDKPRKSRGIPKETKNRLAFDAAVGTGVAFTYGVFIGRRPSQALKAARSFMQNPKKPRPLQNIKTKLGVLRFNKRG